MKYIYSKWNWRWDRSKLSWCMGGKQSQKAGKGEGVLQVAWRRERGNSWGNRYWGNELHFARIFYRIFIMRLDLVRWLAPCNWAIFSLDWWCWGREGGNTEGGGEVKAGWLVGRKKRRGPQRGNTYKGCHGRERGNNGRGGNEMPFKNVEGSQIEMRKRKTKCVCNAIQQAWGFGLL